MEEKRYEILPGLPAYGPMYISIPSQENPAYTEGFPVRFFRSDGTSWVANFEPGWTRLCAIYKLKDASNLLVIAFGTCYIMNPDDTSPISTFGVNYNAAFETEDGRILLQNNTELTIVEASGVHWDTERISWDGLKVLKIESNTVSGLAYDPTNSADEWVAFSLDLDTKILKGGSYY